ncbi:MAG: methyltransferase [Ilumatobacteraceae bacterium]
MTITGTTPETTAMPAGPPPPAIALQLASGFIASQAVYVFTKLGMADALAGGPRPAEVVATRLGTSPDQTRRLLRTLAGFGVVDEVATETYQLTQVGELFRNEPGSLADLTTMWMETHYIPFAGMTGTVADGRSAFQALEGEDYWSWLQHNEGTAELFSRAMGSFGAQTQTAAVAAFDFSPYERIVDVGGAHGSFLASALASSDTSRGVLYDLPHVVDTAGPFLQGVEVDHRVECIGGDFFESVPADGDAYLLSLILHDWDDADCVRILSTIRQAIPSHGVLLVLENVIPDGNEPHLGKVIDMIMMTILNGTERTRAEYSVLLREAGFSIDEVVATQAPTSLIVARPSATSSPRDTR